MRKLITAVVLYALAAASPGWAAKTVPQFCLKNVDGNQRNFQQLAEGYKLVALVFWGIQCDPCKEEMAEFNKLTVKYPDFGIVAVCTDDARTSSQAKPYVKGQGYKFETLLDVDGDLQKGMGVMGTPYSFLVKPTGEVIWEHSGYRKGDEKKLEKEIVNYLAMEPAPGTAEQP